MIYDIVKIQRQRLVNICSNEQGDKPQECLNWINNLQLSLSSSSSQSSPGKSIIKGLFHATSAYITELYRAERAS